MPIIIVTYNEYYSSLYQYILYLHVVYTVVYDPPLLAGPPGEPVDFEIDDMTSVSAWLSWYPNVNGGSDQHFIVYYRLECMEPDKKHCAEFKEDAKVDDPNDLDRRIEHKVSGLNESTSYEFKVMAVNSFNGTGGNNRSTEEKVDQTIGELISCPDYPFYSRNLLAQCTVNNSSFLKSVA